MVRGISTTETDFDITSYRQRWEDPKDFKLDADETPVGFWAGHKKVSSISVEGEITTALTAVPVQVCCSGTVTMANLIDGYGVAAGGLYFDDMEISLGRAEIANFSLNCRRWPNIA